MDGAATVLVVDDSRTKRYLLVNWLTRAGFTVLEAETGGEALSRVGVDPIDLVVLDVRLPDLSGFEVCERIKSAHPALPVIHVSAHAIDTNNRTQGLTRGADAYLAEPIEPEELVATAQSVLRYYQARRRAELLAERLTGLADTTVAVHAAPSFTKLLQVAAAGAAEIFKSPAAVIAETFDGDCLAGVCAGPGAGPRVVPWIVDDTGVPTGATVVVQRTVGRLSTGRPATRSPSPPPGCARTARRSTSWCPPRRRRRVPRCWSSSPRRWPPPWRRNAPLTRSTGSR